jgi:hypothetical protein
VIPAIGAIAPVEAQSLVIGKDTTRGGQKPAIEYGCAVGAAPVGQLEIDDLEADILFHFEESDSVGRVRGSDRTDGDGMPHPVEDGIGRDDECVGEHDGAVAVKCNIAAAGQRLLQGSLGAIRHHLGPGRQPDKHKQQEKHPSQAIQRSAATLRRSDGRCPRACRKSGTAKPT